MNRGGPTVLVAVLFFAMASARCGGQGPAPAPEPPPVAEASRRNPGGEGVLRGHLVWGHEARSLTECGSGREGWVVDETGGDLVEVHAELTTEPYQPLFVEVRGRWEPAPSEGFRSDYAEQLVITELRRAALEGRGCDEDFSGVEYFAHGNEPFWNVKICDTGIFFSKLGRTEGLVFPPATPESAAGTTIYRSEVQGSNATRIEVRITQRRCIDSMSGARFSLAAQVRLQGESFEGCALAGWE